MKDGINTGVLDSKLAPIAVGEYLIDNEPSIPGSYYKVTKDGAARYVVPGTKGARSLKLRDIASSVHIATEEEVADLMRNHNTRYPRKKKEAPEVVEYTMGSDLTTFTDQALADELRRRGFELTCTKTVTITL